MGSVYKGPLLSFSFNGTHSSELQITRVISGSRFNTNLSPAFKDTTVEVPGREGPLYFDTQVQSQEFEINFAFDELTEYEVRKLKQWLAPDQIGELIFDELPFKYYIVKVKQKPTISTIMFRNYDWDKMTDEQKKNHSTRIYKGEGKVTFIAYYPYAKFKVDWTNYVRKWLAADLENEWKEVESTPEWEPYKYWQKVDDGYTFYDEKPTDWNSLTLYINEFYNEIVKMQLEWPGFTHLSRSYMGNITNKKNAEEHMFVNIGDMPAPLIFSFDVMKSGIKYGYILLDGKCKAIIDLKSLTVGDTLKFDSEKGILYNPKNNKIYNDAITVGDFLKIPVGTHVIKFKNFGEESIGKDMIEPSARFY